jgi:hypothetical protein
MKYWVKSTRDGTDSYSIHEGMSQDTVTALLTELGATNIQFITEAEWLAANPPRG